MNNKLNVKKLRRQLGLTQIEMAAKLGVAEYTVRRWEKSTTHPSRMAQKLLAEIKVSYENKKLKRR